jgi:hypothetical protein
LPIGSRTCLNPVVTLGSQSQSERVFQIQSSAARYAGEMANPEHLAKLREGVEAWNAWRKLNPSVTPDLVETNLSGCNLERIDFSGALLDSANLGKAKLVSAYFDHSRLRSADLSDALCGGSLFLFADMPQVSLRDARLSLCHFGGANLLGADLRRSNLLGTSFNTTHLGQSNLRDSTVSATTFSNCDMSSIEGLGEVKHDGPSTIGVDTFYRSGGKIPEAFLRGCGVPDAFITYAKSLIGSPIEFYSCFISYSTKDQEFAERLYADLQARGVRCWFSPHDVKSGQKIHEQIDEAIRLHDKLLLILSPNSMESEWVKTEIAKARKRYTREGKRMLFPMRLVDFNQLRDWECFDADTGKDSAREIREYFIPDFREWRTNHDAYREAFDRLVRDLKAEGTKPQDPG